MRFGTKASGRERDAQDLEAAFEAASDGLVAEGHVPDLLERLGR